MLLIRIFRLNVARHWNITLLELDYTANSACAWYYMSNALWRLRGRCSQAHDTRKEIVTVHAIVNMWIVIERRTFLISLRKWQASDFYTRRVLL